MAIQWRLFDKKERFQPSRVSIHGGTQLQIWAASIREHGLDKFTHIRLYEGDEGFVGIEPTNDKKADGALELRTAGTKGKSGRVVTIGLFASYHPELGSKNKHLTFDLHKDADSGLLFFETKRPVENKHRGNATAKPAAVHDEGMMIALLKEGLDRKDLRDAGHFFLLDIPGRYPALSINKMPGSRWLYELQYNEAEAEWQAWRNTGQRRKPVKIT